MDEQIRYYQNKLAWEIDAWDLHEALGHGQHLVVIDARSPTAYAAGHIPGAINIPHRQMNAATTAEINPVARVVVYCDGTGCNASTKGALAMARLGFRVRELIGGLDWWKRDGYPLVSGSEPGELA